MKAQHAILRFAKYKGPTVSRIEAHNERTKETYASNRILRRSRASIISIRLSLMVNTVIFPTGSSRKLVAESGRTALLLWKC